MHDITEPLYIPHFSHSFDYKPILRVYSHMHTSSRSALLAFALLKMPYLFLLAFPLLFTATGSTNCPHVAGQEILEDTGGINLYLNTTNIPQVPSFVAPNGRLGVIENGVVSPFLSQSEGSSFFAIMSSLREIPMFMTASTKLYYSLSVLSNDDSVVAGPFTTINNNIGVISPGSDTSVSVDVCCKRSGSIVLEGCLTIGTMPLNVLGGAYKTLDPFYASYECLADDVRDCTNSPPLSPLISELCFGTNVTRELVDSEQGSWGLFLRSFIENNFCPVDDNYMNSVTSFLTDPASNPLFPIGPTIPVLSLFFESNANDLGLSWDGPIGYSFDIVSRNLDIVNTDDLNSSIPMQGEFTTSQLDFSVDLYCLSNVSSFTIIDVYLNFSTILNGNIISNALTFFFHRTCALMVNDTNSTAPSTSRPREIIDIIVPSVSGLVLLALVVAVVIIICYCVSIKRKKKAVKKLEEMKVNIERNGNVSASINAYTAMQSLMSVRNPFEILSDCNLEYNYALLKVLDKIGEGFFGDVYKGTAPGLSSGFVAIKTLKNSSDLDTLGKFAKEAWICSKFDHENVIKLLGVCTFGAQKCMIFQYMDLGSLDKLLRKSSPSSPDYNSQHDHLLTPYQFLNVAIQLARGLAYLSSLDFVHRDIASRNCLLDSSYTAKIADFGLSRNIGGNNYYRIGSGNNLLPLRWMPPEAIFFSTFTVKSDVWSYGVLLWEIFTYGKLPYGGLSNHEVIDNVRGAKILDKPDLCPLGVYDIMRSCWYQVPAKRISIQSVLEKLEIYERGEEVPQHNYANLMPGTDLTGPLSTPLQVEVELTPFSTPCSSSYRASMENNSEFMDSVIVTAVEEEGEELAKTLSMSLN